MGVIITRAQYPYLWLAMVRAGRHHWGANAPEGIHSPYHNGEDADDAERGLAYARGDLRRAGPEAASLVDVAASL